MERCTARRLQETLRPRSIDVPARRPSIIEEADEMDIGVVVPTLNSGRTIASALASLLEQRDCRVEVLVADSGSTDATLDVCRRLGVECIYVPPGSMYAAINEGLRRLRGPWLAYLNSDDLLYADAYERLIRLGEAEGADVVYGGSDLVDVAGRYLYSLRAPAPDRLASLFRAKMFGFHPHAAAFRREMFEKLGGFSGRLRHVADMEFFGRACFLGHRFAHDPGAAVAVFRVHGDQLSRRERHVVEEERRTLVGDGWGPQGVVENRVAISRWKIDNLRQYLIRWLRTGSIRRRH
jgi:glycosyltransferase involved in cell wall biosynthesis